MKTNQRCADRFEDWLEDDDGIRGGQKSVWRFCCPALSGSVLHQVSWMSEQEKEKEKEEEEEEEVPWMGEQDEAVLTGLCLPASLLFILGKT